MRINLLGWSLHGAFLGLSLGLLLSPNPTGLPLTLGFAALASAINATAPHWGYTRHPPLCPGCAAKETKNWRTETP